MMTKRMRENKQTDENNKTSTWFLPPRKRKFVEDAKETGKWLPLKFHLSELSKDIDVAAIENVSQFDKEEILASIPSIWAHPILFGIALMDDKHPLHDLVLNEWFGLLGVFCFKKVLNLKFEMKQVNLDKLDDGNGRKFIEALKVVPDVGWRQTSLIYVSGQLIGATSSASLFYTPHSYKCPDAIPWQNDKNQLINPYVYYNDKRNYENKNIFANWLAEVNMFVNKKVGELAKNDDVPENITNISRLIKKITDRITADTKIQINMADAEIHAFPYSFYTQPYDVGEKDSTQECDLFLQSPSGQRKTIIVHSSLWTKDYNVGGGFHTTSFTMPDGKSGDSLNLGKIKNPWINPEKLFLTKNLLKIGVKEESVLFNLTDDDNVTYALPLTLNFFDYFGPEDLKAPNQARGNEAELGISSNSKGKTITLTIQISKGESVKIEKHYAPVNIISIDRKDNPILELWPNFMAKSWKKYYVFTEKEGELQVKPVRSIKNVENMNSSEYEVARFKVFEIENFGGAIEFLYMDKAAGVLLPKLQHTVVGYDSWDVVVDFGTSNTIVAYTTSTSEKKIIFSFKSDSSGFDSILSLQLLEKDRDTRETFLDGNFFSSQPKEIEHPFIYTQINSSGNEGCVVKDGVIYFPNQITGEGSESLKIIGNLKWQAEDQNKAAETINKVRIYLGHILLIICAKARKEGVTEINLSWTYPSAYSVNMRTQVLHANWEKIISEISFQTGVQIRKKEEITESVSVCRYMVSRGAAPAGSDSYVIMDIGGGTTDIGIWFGNKLVLQTSFRLAGNILAELVVAVPSFCNEFMQSVNVDRKLQNELENKVRENPPLYLNHILTTLHDKVDFKNYKYGRSVLYFALSSLFYYTGILLTTIKLMSKDVHIYLGGNASQLFRFVWSTWKDRDSINPLITALKNTLVAGVKAKVNDVDNIIIEFPTTHIKEEAVRGALDNKVRFDALAPPCLIAGERGFTIHGRREVKLELSDDLLQKLGGIDANDEKHFTFDGKDTEIKKFVTCYNNAASLKELDLCPVKIDKQVYKQVANSVGQKYIIEELYKPSKFRIFKPIFISEVKLLCLRKDTFSCD